MAIIDRIKYDGPSDGSQWLVYKYPSEEFVNWSQLIVGEGQEAIFVKGGKAMDLFGPGTYTLDSKNLPILKTFVKIPFGGKTPFSAEVFFINKCAKLDMKWGTANPIPIEDPKYGLILHIGARGQYGVSIDDSRMFINRMVGASPNGALVQYIQIAKYFNGLINSNIKSIIADYMVSKSISFLEIAQYLSELSESFEDHLNSEFDRFGIELVNFFCDHVGPNPDEYKKLQSYKEELALGNDFYVQKRQLDILQTMAENQSTGNISNMGIGLGMGLGVMGQVGQAFSNIGQNVNATNGANNTQINSDIKKCLKCGFENNSNMKFCGHCGSLLEIEVVCPRCGTKNPSNMKFCGECGTPLRSSKCPNCGTENEPGMKFCGGCGKKL